MKEQNGILFEQEFQESLKEKFFMPEADPEFGERLFFDNSGGSLRLRAAVEAKTQMEQFPDCPERDYDRSLYLKGLVQEGTRQMLEIMFRAKPGEGALMTELTASQTMFQMVGIIMENTEGTNAVVSCLEHPSAFDSVEYYCKKLGRELRVIPANPETGRIEPEAVAALVDEGTCLLNVMSASNISGSVMDLAGIVKAARAIKPDLFIISDAVQHAPHMSMDVSTLKLDGMNFAPYKFFGVRGCGYAYVSERVAHMRHHKLLKKDPKVFELGTPAPGNFAAILAVIDYVCEIGKHFLDSADRTELYLEGMRRIHLQERALLYRMLEGTQETPGLRHIPGVKISADPQSMEQRDLIAGIMIDGLTSAECTAEYKKHGVIVANRGADSMYSRRIVTALGAVNGLVRVSPMHIHGTADIDRFLKITAKIAEGAR